MQEKQRTSTYRTETIINLGKSKRLMAMRQSVERRINKDIQQNVSVPSSENKSGELQQAREIIRQRIVEIKATYQQGMQNKLFALRYGSDEKIGQMTLKKLYAILNVKQVLARELVEIKYRKG